MPIVLSDEMVLETMRKVIELRGEDYVYRREGDALRDENSGEYICLYVHTSNGENARPGCAVGYFFHLLGTSLGKLREMEGHSFYNIFTSDTLFPDFKNEFVMSNKAERYLSSFQTCQDDENTYGHCHEVALTYSGLGHLDAALNKAE